MDQATAALLMAETARFYEACAPSFSATRARPWPGWARVLEAAAPALGAATPEDPLAVLDVGCGNFRFERFLLERGVAFRALGVDRCDGLATGAPAQTAYRRCDVSAPGALAAAGEGFGLIAAFGLLHHMPGVQRRADLVRCLAGMLAPGGFLAVSLWRLQDDGRLMAKARDATARFRALHPALELDKNDFLLGWQERDDVFRYCHGFDDAEAALLADAASPAAGLAASFLSDGRSGALNRYLVFRRPAALG